MKKTPRSNIASTIAAHTHKDGITKDYAREVAAMLLYEGRVGELESLLRDIQADWAQQGFVEVLAYSAHPLSDGVKAEITAIIKREFPQAEHVVVTEIADPSVVGSVKIRLAHQQLDLSIEAKLNKFKQLTGAGKE
jgi:F0F1-type ATP synthase delta subunit